MTILSSRISISAVLLLVAIAVAATGFLASRHSPTQRASAASGGSAEMVLTLPSHDNCDDLDQPTICTLATSTTFTISVDLLNPPPIGYIHAQAWLDYDSQGLVNKKNTQATWPDCEPQTLLTINDVASNGAQGGCLTGLLTQPPSFHEGSIYTFALTCTDSQSTSTLRLLPSGDPVAGTSGTDMHDINGGHPLQKLGGGVTIECLGLPEPGDTDGDGCSDEQEFGNDETMGGQRDYLNPWDYYDVVGPAGGPPDGRIDLPNDILSVLQHFSPQGQPPYDIAFDRGHRDGNTLWSMTAPDGVIDLPVDILGVIYQFGHNCS